MLLNDIFWRGWGGGGGGLEDGEECTYFGWPDSSKLSCLQIRYERMACLDSVKQENDVRGTHLQRIIIYKSQVQDAAY